MGRVHMKLKNEFITHDTGSESLLVPTGAASWSGIVRGNRTLGAILLLLRDETTEEEVVAALQERYDVLEDVVKHDVAHVLDQLRQIDALDE
jgi:hypothetical protein